MFTLSKHLFMAARMPILGYPGGGNTAAWERFPPPLPPVEWPVGMEGTDPDLIFVKTCTATE